MIKKYTISLISIFLFAQFACAQVFSVGSSASLTIQSGTLFSADNLLLTPSSDFAIGNNSLSENTAVINANQSSTTISEAFKFLNTTNSYNGTIQIKYSTSSLNGLTESTLQPYIHNGSSWGIYNALTNNTSSHYVVSQALSSILLNELSLIGSNNVAIFVNRNLKPENFISGVLFEAKAYPNPSPSSFHLTVNTRSVEDVHVVVSDVNGRRVKEMKIIPGMDTLFGNELINGIYFVEIIQGKNRKVLKLEKLQ